MHGLQNFKLKKVHTYINTYVYTHVLIHIHIHTHTHTERGVGSGIAIFRSGESIKTIKFRLNKKCTNNQAEQFAILSALEYIKKIKTKEKRATIYTDSQTTLDKLQNSNIHSH
jgi:ribonuclease HI